MTSLQRTYWHRPGLDDLDTADSEGMNEDDVNRKQVDTIDESNLIGSLVQGHEAHDPEALHLPVLDFDFPCELRPSSSPGHYHLFIDRPLEWAKYEKVLNVFAEVGLIQRGYEQASVARGMTHVRTRPTKPTVKPSAGGPA